MYDTPLITSAPNIVPRHGSGTVLSAPTHASTATGHAAQTDTPPCPAAALAYCLTAYRLVLTAESAHVPGETCSITRYAVAVSCAPVAATLMCTVTASCAASQSAGTR